MARLHFSVDNLLLIFDHRVLRPWKLILWGWQIWRTYLPVCQHHYSLAMSTKQHNILKSDQTTSDPHLHSYRAKQDQVQPYLKQMSVPYCCSFCLSKNCYICHLPDLLAKDCPRNKNQEVETPASMGAKWCNFHYTPTTAVCKVYATKMHNSI